MLTTYNASYPVCFICRKKTKSISYTRCNTFLNNIIFQCTNPLPFETEPHTIHTIPVAREHSDSYLYYIRYKTLEKTPSQQPFQIIFNPVEGINNGIYYRTIHPQNITLFIQDLFIIYMQRLIDFNENLDPPLYLPSHLED